jgi:protein phosphatase
VSDDWGAEFKAAAAVEEEPEITARFNRGELVRGWMEREPALPRCVPILKAAARTDLGRVRENNEDKYEIYETEDPTLLATRGCLYMVADGMGGHAAGQIASELTLKQLVVSYYDNPTASVANALDEAVTVANGYVFSVASTVLERSGMGTTLTALAMVQDKAFVAQVGDSRAYLLRDGEIRQVTNDHTWVAEQVRMGYLALEEAEQSPYRNVITRAIGTQPEVECDLFEEEARIGDIWVLCSDGLTGHVEDDEIRLIASTQNPAETCRQLVELAGARGGRDNITVLTVAVRGFERPGRDT